MMIKLPGHQARSWWSRHSADESADDFFAAGFISFKKAVKRRIFGFLNQSSDEGVERGEPVPFIQFNASGQLVRAMRSGPLDDEGGGKREHLHLL